MEYNYKNNINITAILEKNPIFKKTKDGTKTCYVELRLRIKPQDEKSFQIKVKVFDDTAFEQLQKLQMHDIIEITGEFILDSYIFKEKFWIEAIIRPTRIALLGRYTKNEQHVEVHV